MIRDRRSRPASQESLRPAEPVDFVVTWVDPSDKEWQRQRDAHAEALGAEVSLDGNQSAMYRDHDMLRYWFRAVAEYAPWVRKVHFVTEGHVPEWLNTEHPKLAVVKHADIMDSADLPTFNPRAIQAGFDRIPDLAENFVVFDDDTLLNQPVSPQFFFPKGLPYGMALPNALALRSSHSHALLNVSGLLNEHFKQREVLKRHWRKWLSPKYGLELYRSIALLPWPYILPFAISHLPVPLTKTSMTEAYAAASDDLDSTSARRFRDPRDMLPVQLAAAWQVVTGRFSPVRRSAIGQSFDLGAHSVKDMTAALRNPQVATVCFNDSTKTDTSPQALAVSKALSNKLPYKSPFER